MTTAIQPSGKQGALLVAGILMIATTLRVTFTGVAPARHHPTGLWLKHGANRPAHNAAPACLRLYLSLAAGVARRRAWSAAFYRSAADLHRDWRTFAAVGRAAVYRYGDRGLWDCAGQCPVTGLIKRDFPGGRKTHGAYSLTMGPPLPQGRR